MPELLLGYPAELQHRFPAASVHPANDHPVDAARRTLIVDTIAGYQAPSDFNTPRTPDKSDAIYGFVFRNGVPIPQTGDLIVKTPLSGNVLTLGAPGDPWAQAANLNAIQPGDTLLMTRSRRPSHHPFHELAKLHRDARVHLRERHHGP